MQHRMYLGVDCNLSVPPQWKSKDLPMITDGLYLYLVAYEEDWSTWYEDMAAMKVTMEEEKRKKEEERQRKIEEERKKKRAERKAGVNQELVARYKNQYQSKKKKSEKTESEAVEIVSDPIAIDENMPKNDK